MSMTADEMIAVIAARRDGKFTEARELNPVPWEDGSHVRWHDTQPQEWPDFKNFEFRIKPEPPKPREFWIGWCEKHGPALKVWDEMPIPQCPHCTIIHTREVLEASAADSVPDVPKRSDGSE